MQVTVGRIVHYILSETDAEQINRRRTSRKDIAERINNNEPNNIMWPEGAQAHIGWAVLPGEVFPMIVTKATESIVNGQVFLDGNDCLWVVGITQGLAHSQWQWPPRVV